MRIWIELIKRLLTRSAFHVGHRLVSGSRAPWDIDLLMGLVHYLFDCPNFSLEWHCQWVLCTVYGTHKHLFSPKNGFHDTIHTFKNYFATVFSIFSKINDIQTDPKCMVRFKLIIPLKELKCFYHIISPTLHMCHVYYNIFDINNELLIV